MKLKVRDCLDVVKSWYMSLSSLEFCHQLVHWLTLS